MSMDSSKIAINHIKDETSHVQFEIADFRIADLNFEGFGWQLLGFKIHPQTSIRVQMDGTTFQTNTSYCIEIPISNEEEKEIKSVYQQIDL